MGRAMIAGEFHANSGNWACRWGNLVASGKISGHFSALQGPRWVRLQQKRVRNFLRSRGVFQRFHRRTRSPLA